VFFVNFTQNYKKKVIEYLSNADKLCGRGWYILDGCCGNVEYIIDVGKMDVRQSYKVGI